MRGRPGRGHRRVPHTADVRIEAWAPNREQCLAEAVTALVATFADVSGARPVRPVELTLPPGGDADHLVALLDEVVYRMDSDGLLPLGTRVTAADGTLSVRFEMADTDAVELVGAVPKAVSLHDLRFAPGTAGWSCAVTLDV